MLRPELEKNVIKGENYADRSDGLLPESTLTLYDNLNFCSGSCCPLPWRGHWPGAHQAPEGGGGADPLHHCLRLGGVHDPVQIRIHRHCRSGRLPGGGHRPHCRPGGQRHFLFWAPASSFKNGSSIRGLTTAAGHRRAVGMAIGAGMYWLGPMEAVVLVVIQLVLHRFRVGGDAESPRRSRCT